MGESIPPVVARIAAALDGDDFDEVRASLDPACVYSIGGETHTGAEAVVASYRGGSELGRRLFDEVVYDHEIAGPVAADTYRVHFVDHLVAGGETFVHTSVQDLSVGSNGLITRIEDRHVDGERERLDGFMARHGISRSD